MRAADYGEPASSTASHGGGTDVADARGQHSAAQARGGARGGARAVYLSAPTAAAYLE